MTLFYWSLSLSLIQLYILSGCTTTTKKSLDNAERRVLGLSHNKIVMLFLRLFPRKSYSKSVGTGIVVDPIRAQKQVEISLANIFLLFNFFPPQQLVFPPFSKLVCIGYIFVVLRVVLLVVVVSCSSSSNSGST